MLETSFAFLTAFVTVLIVYYFRDRVRREHLERVARHVAAPFTGGASLVEEIEPAARFDWGLINQGHEFGKAFVATKYAPAGFVTCDYCGGSTRTAARGCEGCGAPLPASSRRVEPAQVEPAAVELPPVGLLAVGAVALMLMKGNR